MNDDGPPHPISLDDQRPDEDRRADPVALDRWRDLVARVLGEEGVPASAELSVLFVDEAAMTALNVEHMGGDGPTDVLAFPIDGPDVAAGDHPATSGPDGPPIVLGDVVICPSVARRNAAAHGVSEEDELALLVVHGVLHVLGHDHAEAEETAVMKGREQLHLRHDRAAGST